MEKSTKYDLLMMNINGNLKAYDGLLLSAREELLKAYKTQGSEPFIRSLEDVVKKYEAILGILNNLK